MNTPIICFGQQPAGFFPKKFLVAKISTAKKLAQEIGSDASVGGPVRVVFFYHDSDADYRETITLMKDRQTGAEVRLNFTQENKIQKKFSPLYLKKISPVSKEEILKQLPRFVDKDLISIFNSVQKDHVADFCLEMYQKMGLLEGIEVIRSSDQNFRDQAGELQETFFADIPYENEIVRAEYLGGIFRLHEGGGKYLTLPNPGEIKKTQKTPGRDQRFAWMNQVVKATHYVTGNSEYDYLKRDEFPEVKFIKRDQIDNSEFAYLND